MINVFLQQYAPRTTTQTSSHNVTCLHFVLLLCPQIQCSVECTTSASSAFEGKGLQFISTIFGLYNFSLTLSEWPSSGGKDLNVILSKQLENIMLRSKAVDLEALCVIPGSESALLIQPCDAQLETWFSQTIHVKPDNRAGCYTSIL